MLQYNYSDENLQAGVNGLKKAAKTMPVTVMEPLLGGKLATGLPKEAVEIFKKINPGLSPAGWALNWVWNQEEVSVLISGMSDINALKENISIAGTARAGMLGEEELSTYQKALEVINQAYKVRCTGCNYCMPCPKGVNIPGCFAAYNTSYSMGYGMGMQQFIQSTALVSEHSGSPGLCTKCGKCEPLCPQKLPIAELLGKVSRRMEPFYLKFAIAIIKFFFGKKRNTGTRD
jgi:predicted aldo/keto reductase-like oxidoreductase